MGHYEETDDYADFLTEIVDGGHLDDPALGITKLVIAKGEAALSEKQKFVFHKGIDEFVTDECTRCSADIPWSEMYAAYDNGGLCSWCDHMVAKDD